MLHEHAYIHTCICNLFFVVGLGLLDLFRLFGLGDGGINTPWAGHAKGGVMMGWEMRRRRIGRQSRG